jgi:hypothetical protein
MIKDYLKAFKKSDNLGTNLSSSEVRSLMKGSDATSHTFYIALFISRTLSNEFQWITYSQRDPL